MTCLGVSSLGKASYVITLTPYFVLTALLAYAAPREVLKYDGERVWYINRPTLTQGALDGMKQLFEPEWEKMGNYDVSWALYVLSSSKYFVHRFGAPLHLRYFSRFLLVTVASWLFPVTTSSTTTAPGMPSLSASATPSPPCSPDWLCSRFSEILRRERTSVPWSRWVNILTTKYLINESNKWQQSHSNLCLSAINRTGIYCDTRGHSRYGHSSTLVLPFLLHDGQPRPFLYLQAWTNFSAQSGAQGVTFSTHSV